jgi:hypothetical protein
MCVKLYFSLFMVTVLPKHEGCSKIMRTTIAAAQSLIDFHGIFNWVLILLCNSKFQDTVNSRSVISLKPN